jgi:hypothetical protein
VDARDEQGATWEILRNRGSINHDGQVAGSGKDERYFYLRSVSAISGIVILLALLTGSKKSDRFYAQQIVCQI